MMSVIKNWNGCKAKKVSIQEFLDKKRSNNFMESGVRSWKEKERKRLPGSNCMIINIR
jgi:hypothetical protein